MAYSLGSTHAFWWALPWKRGNSSVVLNEVRLRGSPAIDLGKPVLDVYLYLMCIFALEAVAYDWIHNLTPICDFTLSVYEMKNSLRVLCEDVFWHHLKVSEWVKELFLGFWLFIFYWYCLWSFGNASPCLWELWG